MDQKSIAGEELEYEFLRSLCDLAVSYHRIAETSGTEMPRISETIGFLEDTISEMQIDFGDLEIVF